MIKLISLDENKTAWMEVDGEILGLTQDCRLLDEEGKPFSGDALEVLECIYGVHLDQDWDNEATLIKFEPYRNGEQSIISISNGKVSLLD